VHRLSGETYRTITVAPAWSIDKIGVHNAISRTLENRDTWQGRLFRIKQVAVMGQPDSHCQQGAEL
jgi:radical SAM superfamily enzyme